MSFFDAPPPPEPEPQPFSQPSWLGPPQNMLGAPVPLRLLLARTERAVAALTGCDAYPNGVAFDFALRLRPDSLTIAERRALMHGGLFHRVGPVEGDELPPELFRFGVLFADGRKATSVNDRRAFMGQDEPDGPFLMPRGGGGGELSWNMDFWLWPLPPAGPLTFVVEWPALGIAETRVESDATAIVEAAATTETLWPEGGGPAAAGGRSFTFQSVSSSRETGQTDRA